MKIGSSKFKQRAQLKTTAPSNDWFKNVVKSVGYATSDIVKETIPSAFEFAESNGREALELYQQLRQDGPKSVTKMLSDSIEKNQYVKIANEAISNMKEDLKSGKIYNKEREERAVLGDDFDFDFGDEDFNFGDDDSDIQADADAGTVQNIKKVTVNNINANITKNNPMVQSLEKQSEMMIGLTQATNKTNIALATTSYTLTSRVASDIMTGISSVNDNLSALVNFNNDSMSKYVAASLQYYEDSLNFMKQTLEASVRPVAEQKQSTEEPDLFLGNGGLNIRNYAGRVKKNVKTTIESDLMLNSIYGMATDTDTLKMLAANPLKGIPVAISKIVVPGIIRESAKQFDESFSAFFPALLQKFNRMANQDGSWITKTIGQVFGYNPKASTTVEIDKYHKGDMNFNGITQKAITEVIPAYLRKILSAVSGGNEMLFDYQKGKFVDYMEASDKRKKEDRDSAFNSMEMYNELKGRLNAIEFTDETYKKEMMEEFDNLMFKLARSGGGVNPNVRTGKNGEVVDELKDMYSSQFTEIFRSAILSLNSSQQMKLMGSDLFNAKTSYGKRIDDIQNNIGSSLIPVLEAWDSSGDYKKDNKTGAYTRKDPLAHITKDKYGKTTLDYLREVRNILLEGVITFPNGSGGGVAQTSANNSNGQQPEIFTARRNRLSAISREDEAQTTVEQAAQNRVIRNYSQSDLERKQSKGIKVVQSTSDLLSDVSNDQMIDMFKNYVQIRDADEESENQQKGAGGWIRKMLSKGGKKVEGVRDIFDNVLSLPGRVVSNVLTELDGGLYKLVFGVNPDGSDRSFLSKVTTSIKESFGGFFDWTKEKFFEPIKEALFGEDGFFTKIKNSEAMKKLKGVGSKMADWAFGNADETGHRRNGAFSEAFNEVADIGRSVGSVFTGREYTDRHGNVHAANQNSVFGNVNAFTGEVWNNARTYLFGNRQRQRAPQASAPLNYQQMNLDEYMASMPQAQPQGTQVSTGSNTQLDLFDQMGNGGDGMLSKVIGWLQNNLKLQYKVGTDDSDGEAKTVPFGQSVNDEVAKGGIAPTMVNGFPYFSQRDPRYANYAYNLSTGKGGGDSLSFADRGCGPTALAMVASGMGRQTDPIDLANVATEAGYSVEGGTKGSFFSSIGDKLGLNVKEKQTDESKVNSAIREGKPIIFRGRKTTDSATPFTNDGHFVVGVGGKNGKISINDPNGPMTSGEYDIKDIVSESNKMWTFDDTGKGSSSLGKGPSTNPQPTNLGVGNWVRDASRDGTNEIRGVFGELAEGFYAAGTDMISLTFGDQLSNEDDESKAKKFATKFREMLPKGLAGGIIGGGLGTVVAATGGMGLLGSMFLPGGPVGAAILGTAVGFASQSEKFKNWLFGEKDPEDASKRLGGFISQKTQKFVKDNKGTIIGGAAVGGIKGVLTGAGLLPGLLFGGPLTGAIMGAGMGLALRSEKFQNMVFGKDDPDTGKKIGGLLSKSYNGITDHKKQIGGAGIGLLGGAAAGTVLSSMGIMGSAFFLGPIGGAIAGAGLGIAAASDKWRDKVFGTLNDDTKKREGGLLQEFKSGLTHNVLVPLKDAAKETAADMKFWFQEKVMLPIADLFGPFKTAIGMITEDIMYKLTDIADGVKYTFNKFIGEPLGNFLKEKVFDKLQAATSTMFNGFKGIVKFIAGSPFKMLDLTLNKMGASIVQKKTRKRRDKYESAMQELSTLEDRKVRNELSEKELRRYEKLRKTEARYYGDAYDQDKLNAKDNFKEIRAKRVGEIQKEKESKMSELRKERELHKKQQRFNSIFGSTVEFDENLLTEYDKIFKRDNGKAIKGKKNKALIRKEATEFAQRYKEGKVKDVSAEVKDIRDNIKDNLTPIRKTLYNINDAASAIAKALGAKVVNTTAPMMNNLAAKLPGNKKKQRKADELVRTTLDNMRASDEREAYVNKTNDGVDIREKYANAFKTANASEERKAQLKAKYRSGEGSGGRKDPSWMMYGKGKEKEEKPKKDKKGGFLSSLGSSMFGALKKFDKVNDKEEEEKAQEKEAKTKLAEKQKEVSSKNYAALKQELIARNKEAQEKTWKDNLLNAVTSIKEKTKEHLVNWSDIFSKKGLITMGLIAALPKILEFLKDPAKFIKDTMSSILSNIKISIDWLFGKGNDGRQDENGETIQNTGLEDATARLTRNSVMKGAKYLMRDDTIGGKAARVITRAGKKIYNAGKNIVDSSVSGAKGASRYIKRLKLSDGTKALIDQGFTSADELVKLGVTSVDDLMMMGVSSVDDLAALGITSVDDLAKVGIKSTDDIAKFGVELGTRKGSKGLSKVGLKLTDDVLQTGSLSYGVKTSLKETVGGALSTAKTTVGGVVNKATAPLLETGSKVATSVATAGKKVASNTTSAIVSAGKKATNSKFVKAVTDWIQGFFTSKSVIKELGQTAAAKALKDITGKISKAFTETVLEKFANKISIALAKVGGRIAGAATTAGVLTAGFAVADFISGAVNTERLFEIPAGTATFEMKTISALLQTALGIGMVGPLIDVANEIVAEVLGINILSMMASIMYGCIVSEDKALELSNLQTELDAAYAAYKEVNGLEDLSKKAYIDMTNPSFGTKVWNKTKDIGNALTGNFFNGDKIRETLGKSKDDKVTITDRFSQLTGSTLGAVSFGLLDGDNITKKMAGGLDTAKQWTKDKIKGGANWAKDTWNNGKQWTKDKIKGGLQWADDTWNNGKQWTKEKLNDGKEWAKNTWDGTKELAANAWDGTKKFAADSWDGTKKFAANAWDGTKQLAANAWSGTKDIAKKTGNAITGNVFNDSEIRKQLGLNDNVDVTLKDRISMGASSLIEAVSFGNVKSEDVIKNIYGIQTQITDKATELWQSTKDAAYEKWNDAKKFASDTADAAGKKVTGLLGLYDENGEPLPFGAGMSKIKDNAIETIKTKWSDLKNGATDWINSTNEKMTKKWSEFKTGVSDGLTKLDSTFGGLLGFQDENGNPLSLTKGSKQIVEKSVSAVRNKFNEIKNGTVKWWEDTKTSMSQNWTNFKQSIPGAIDNVNKTIGGWLGFHDENGNPVSLTQGSKQLVENSVNAVRNKYNEIKNGTVQWWEDTKVTMSENWTNFKESIPGAMDKLNSSIGGWFGFHNDDGEQLSLTDGLSHAKNKFLDGISGAYKDIMGNASDWWNDTKTTFKDNFDNFKTNLSEGMNELNKALGRLMGFQDKNGNAISLTDAVKNKWSETVDTASNLWTSFKSWFSNDTKATAEADIAARNAGNGGYGGFGEPAMPQNIGARGCGPTAMAMVTSRLTGSPIDPVVMSNLATQGGFAGSYGTNGAYFNYAANQFGIASSETKTTSSNLTKALNSGQPVILRGQSNGEKGSAFTRAGHYVVAVGAKDGKVIINDPRGEQYSGAYKMSDVVNQSNVMWSFGNSRNANQRNTSLVLGGASTDSVPGELILQYALIHKGKPYVYGANGPSSFDCSGLVNYVVKQAGIKLPASRPTAEIWRKNTTSISKADLKVGDLGFLVDKTGRATHVGIYAGDGLWCHAEGGPGEKGAGGSVVLNDRTYWTHYGRIPGVSGNTTTYSETSGVSSLAFNGQNSGSTSLISNIAGYLSEVFNTGINSATTGQLGTFKTYSEYLANNGSPTTDGNYTDTVGSVSLGSRKTTADLLNKTLGGRLAGKGSTIVSIGNKYGVDPAVLAAILHHESANGTSNAIINKNNPGGIMDASTGHSTLKSFSSLEEGIEYTASNLKRNYIDQGINTIDKIGAKYAPVGAANDPRNLNSNWVKNVTKLYNDTYSSETGYGGFGEGFAPIETNPSFKFGDKMSELGGMGDYLVASPKQMNFSDSESDDKVVGVMETMVEVLKTIAENTGATSSNIKDAMHTAINKISSTNSNVNVNNITSNGTKTVKTSSNYSAKEAMNRSVAERIAAGKFA